MPETKVGIVIEAQDKATKQLQNIGGQLNTMQSKLKSMQPTFQKMAIAGTAAFGAITAGVLSFTKEAGVAEGAYNKFNTVFADGADDMMKFITDLRKTMPTATHEIVRMAADLQDLLVPMGVARDKAQDMSKGFLDVANKIAAFNDVPVAQVLEAMRSGLAGSSEPLRRFGINAMETSLEFEALSSGLLQAGQKFADLEPTVKTSIRAQALLQKVINDSSDAINGFEENQDSYLRRQEELKASFGDLKVKIGETFLPILDDLLKKLLPIVDKVIEWVKENPELTQTIITVAGAVAGIVAVLGTLGLVLPTVITGVQLLGGAIAFVAANPIVLLIAAIGLIIYNMYKLIKNWEQTKDSINFIWETIKELWGKATDWVGEKIDKLIGWFTNLINKVKDAMSFIDKFSLKNVGEAWSNLPANLGLTKMAEGGIVTRPTPALVGEGGEPEAVIPLSKLNRIGGGIVININGGNYLSEQAGLMLGDQIIEQLKRQLKI